MMDVQQTKQVALRDNTSEKIYFKEKYYSPTFLVHFITAH